MKRNLKPILGIAMLLTPLFIEIVLLVGLIHAIETVVISASIIAYFWFATRLLN